MRPLGSRGANGAPGGPSGGRAGALGGGGQHRGAGLRHVAWTARSRRTGAAVHRIQIPDGDVLYSLFFGFENPQVTAELVRDFGSEQPTAAFASFRGSQGLPVGDDQPLLQDAIARCLLLAPRWNAPMTPCSRSPRCPTPWTAICCAVVGRYWTRRWRC